MTLFRRELGAYFNAAIAYIFIIVFVLLNGGLFMTQFFLYNRADMRQFFSTLPFILSVFLPAVTMRLWAEEKRGNTLELLLTFPVPTSTLVIGKFLASFVFYLVALLGTVTIPVMISAIGHPDVGAMVSGYLGAAMMGGFFLAVGIFISGLCHDQIVAFILSMIICFGLYLSGTTYLSTSIDGWFPGLGSFLARFIGAAGHYDTFGKGVIDSSDLFYFLIGTTVFLVLNGLWFDGRMKPGAKKIFTVATFVAVAIFLMTNWLLADLPLGRFDLTEGRIYTISPATKKILKSLTAPVSIKFYVSSADKMPTEMKTLEQDVIGKLDELRVSSGGHFDYKIFHMEAANAVEQNQPNKKEGDVDSLEKQLQEKGINPFQVRAVESDEVAVRLVYSSISIGYKEKLEEMIPRLLPDNLHELEYMIISKIYRMTLETKPKVALVAPYEEKKIEPQMQELLKQLGGQIPEGYRDDLFEVLPMALKYEGYEVARIKLDKDETIPSDVTTLVVAEPKSLNDRQKYEINRFLASGGDVFFAVQNYEYDYQPRGNQLSIQPKEKKPEINSLLSQWGFEVDEQVLVDEQHDVINLSGAMRGPFEMSIPVKVPIQVLIPASGMNPNVSVTSRLSSMFYLWGTALKINDSKVKQQNLKVDTLLHSSDHSWTVPFKAGSITPQDLVQQQEGRVGPFPLAVMVSGQFADVYKDQTTVPAWPVAEVAKTDSTDPNAKPAEPAKNVELEKATPISLKPGKMILIGASSLFQKNLIRNGGNLNFFMNSIDAISLGEELVTIRSKQPVDRGLGRVSAPVKAGWRIFVTFLVPLLLTVIGTLRVFLRRQAKQNYMKEYAELAN